MPPSPRPPRAAARALTSWYRRHARDLPWRRDPHPYRVLVSEVMLQQTTVDVVIPYFERFMDRYPDAAALAAAPEEELLSAWAGLGYYRRARNLQEAARRIVDLHGGEVPAGRQALLSLPGVGPYTAAAVRAIAHGAPEIALDGNLKRVLGRYAGFTGDPGSAAGVRELERIGAGLLEGADPAVINQALMDLGASHCSVREPRCLLCPLEEHCVALSKGLVERIPPARRRTPPVEVLLAAGLVRRGRRVLMRRRRGRLMPGMLEFPMVEVWRSGGSTRRRASREHRSEEEAARALRRELEGAGLKVEAVEEAGRLRHGITHHRLTVLLFDVMARGSLAGTQVPLTRSPSPGREDAADLAGSEDGELVWVAARDLQALPLTGIAKKISPRLGPLRGRGRPARTAEGIRTRG